jgi:hypothetical protein
MTTKGSKRVLSAGARRKMGVAGLANLAKYKASINTRVQELDAEVNAYRDGLLKDAGPNLTTTKRGFIEGAASAYAAVLKVRHSMIHSRKRDVEALTAVLSAATGSLLRCLRTLDLDRKPRPRSLADIPEPTQPVAAPKSTV